MRNEKPAILACIHTLLVLHYLSHTITTTGDARSIQYQDEPGMRVVDGHTCTLHCDNVADTLLKIMSQILLSQKNVTDTLVSK